MELTGGDGTRQGLSVHVRTVPVRPTDLPSLAIQGDPDEPRRFAVVGELPLVEALDVGHLAIVFEPGDQGVQFEPLVVRVRGHELPRAWRWKSDRSPVLRHRLTTNKKLVSSQRKTRAYSFSRECRRIFPQKGTLAPQLRGCWAVIGTVPRATLDKKIITFRFKIVNIILWN